jgi:hypothetical protein
MQFVSDGDDREIYPGAPHGLHADYRASYR